MIELKKPLFPDTVTEILGVLEANGHEAFVVGGAVRDILLGIEPKDYDITTSAEPKTIVDLFKKDSDMKVSDVDAKSYHIVVVNEIEVATYRKDIYENGETVGTEIVGSLTEDLGRRDLTINAMAMDVRGKLFDPAMGEGDLEIRRIRFVGFAPDRIMEDPNRIFRAARFFATIDGKFSDHTIHSLKMLAHLAASVAPERIREEILKSMKTYRPSLFFDALHEIGILKHVFPELHQSMDQDGGPYHMETVYQHSMIVGNEIKTDNPMLRLVAFLHDIGKIEPNFVEGVVHFYYHQDIGADMIERNLKALRFTNKEIKFAKNLVAVHMRGGIKAGPKGIRKILKKFAELDVDYKDWIELKIADRRGNLKRKPFDQGQIDHLRRKFEHEINPVSSSPSGLYVDVENATIKPAFLVGDLAISGTVIQELLGINPSEVIGVILSWLLDRVIAKPELNTRKQLERLIVGKPKKIKFTAEDYHNSLF